MTASDWALLVPAIIVLITSLAAYLQSLANSRDVKAVSQQVSAVHLSINGRLSQLLASTSDAAHAAGVAGQAAAPVPPVPPALPPVGMQ